LLWVSLLTLCRCQAEVRCQSLYSVAQIQRQLVDPINLRSIKKTFTKFLDEVRAQRE